MVFYGCLYLRLNLHPEFAAHGVKRTGSRYTDLAISVDNTSSLGEVEFIGNFHQESGCLQCRQYLEAAKSYAQTIQALQTSDLHQPQTMTDGHRGRWYTRPHMESA